MNWIPPTAQLAYGPALRDLVQTLSQINLIGNAKSVRQHVYHKHCCWYAVIDLTADAIELRYSNQGEWPDTGDASNLIASSAAP